MFKPCLNQDFKFKPNSTKKPDNLHDYQAFNRRSGRDSNPRPHA